MVGAAVAAVVAAGVVHGSGFLAPAWPAPLAAGHSHNDEEQRRPLAAALASGFASIEADVRWRGGRLVVAHSRFDDRGTLDDLYLRPLQARVDRLGSVHGDGRPFWLWVDLKDGSSALVEALATALERYPMLTVFTDAATFPGAVTVVLTGDEAAKRRYVETRAVRRACRDAEEVRPDDGPADRRFTWYALPWGALVPGAPSEVGFRAAVARMRDVVARIHALGRRIRLYEVPERDEAWGAALDAGIDLVSTDRVEAFRDWALRRGRAARAVRTWAAAEVGADGDLATR